MNSFFFEARIGEWTKKIRIDTDSLIPDHFPESLSFLLSESNHGPADFVFSEEVLQHSSRIYLPKGPKKVFWANRLRHVEHKSFTVRIDQLGKRAAISSPISWEDLSELVEAWVGLQYEHECGVRLHGVCLKNMTLLAASGFGKSYIASKYWDSLIADEVLFIADNNIQNWSSSVRTKEPGVWKTRHGERSIKTKRSCPRPLPPIYFGESTSWSVFWGIGLPQHAEFSFSLRNLSTWLTVAHRRFDFIRRQKLWTRPMVDRKAANKLAAANIPDHRP